MKQGLLGQREPLRWLWRFFLPPLEDLGKDASTEGDQNGQPVYGCQKRHMPGEVQGTKQIGHSMARRRLERAKKKPREPGASVAQFLIKKN